MNQPDVRGSHTTWLEIDGDALRHNARALRALVRPARLLAVVKGNAYGHGMVAVARALAAEVDWFGVNSVEEARLLADGGHTKPILIMGGTMPGRLDEVVRHGFRQVVYDEGGAAALAAAAKRQGCRATAHLEVETGTNRLGARLEALVRLAAFVRGSESLTLEGISTHFANVEDTIDGSYAEHQLRRFQEGLAASAGDGPPPIRHTAATAAGILYPQTHFSMVRAGIGLYGLWPSTETREAAARAGVALQLRPVLSWKAHIVHVNDVPFGEPIGYGCTYVATRPRRIAVLPVGYAEGFDRSLSNRGRVLVGGRLCPVVGRVMMNMVMVDITDVPGAAVGDEAVLIGEQGGHALPAEDMAALLDTINYEVVTRISPSVPRVWTGADPPG